MTDYTRISVVMVIAIIITYLLGHTDLTVMNILLATIFVAVSGLTLLVKKIIYFAMVIYTLTFRGGEYPLWYDPAKFG